MNNAAPSLGLARTFDAHTLPPTRAPLPTPPIISRPDFPPHPSWT